MILCFINPLCGFQTAFEALVQLDEQAVSVQLYFLSALLLMQKVYDRL